MMVLILGCFASLNFAIDQPVCGAICLVAMIATVVVDLREDLSGE